MGSTEKGSVRWMWAEGVVGRTVGGCLSRTELTGALGGSHRAQFVALQQRELVGKGRAGSWGLSAHWACCVPRSFQHMAEALELTKEEEEKRLPLKKRCWKSTSHSVWEQFFQTLACVTPPLISNVVKRLSSRFTRCIYDEPEVMIDSPGPGCSRGVGIAWPALGGGSMAAGVLAAHYLFCFMSSSLAQEDRLYNCVVCCFVLFFNWHHIMVWICHLLKWPESQLCRPALWCFFTSPLKRPTSPHGEQGQDVAALFFFFFFFFLFWQPLPPSRLRTVPLCLACSFLWFLLCVTDLFTVLGCRVLPTNSLESKGSLDPPACSWKKRRRRRKKTESDLTESSANSRTAVTWGAGGPTFSNHSRVETRRPVFKYFFMVFDGGRFPQIPFIVKDLCEVLW